MQKITNTFSSSSVDQYYDAGFDALNEITDIKKTILVTDKNVHDAHPEKFRGWDTIVLKAGEKYKVQSTVDSLIEQLIKMKASRETTLVGVGGGVVTDLVGYTASVYMRGIRFGFVPTSLLCMVDAAIGGKNGIDAGVFKNMVGVISQPSFLLYDFDFLDTLPGAQWKNGFAEIIKHACIMDAAMFSQLEENSLKHYRKTKADVIELVKRNALLKTSIVQQDEFERSERRLLNFGHTLGHALENQYKLLHGQAVAIGMVFAALVSSGITGFSETERITGLLEKYGLPSYAAFKKNKVFEVMRMDKKREQKEINYVLLEKIGHAVIKPIPLITLKKFIREL